MTWDGLAAWWVEEVTSDPAYDDVVTPLVLSLLGDAAGLTLLDVGCGEGRIMRELSGIGARPVGIDLELNLLQLAHTFGPCLRADLPDLPLASGSVDGAVISLVLEHLPDHAALLGELGRVIKDEGHLALVVNHPMFTAPDSAPIADADGETLWRPGRYFDPGYTEEPAGEGVIRFHHRTTGELLTDAASAGFCLERMVELGPDESQIEQMPVLAQQRHIPRLLGLRWRKAPGRSS